MSFMWRLPDAACALHAALNLATRSCWRRLCSRAPQRASGRSCYLISHRNRPRAWTWLLTSFWCVHFPFTSFWCVHFPFTDLVQRGPPLKTWPACDTDSACVNSQAQYFMPDSRAVAALASLSRGPADPPRELICERDCLLRQRHSALKPMSVRPAPDRTPSDGRATTPARARHARHGLSAAGAEAESGVGGAAAFGRAHRLHRRSARRRTSVCEWPSAARCHASGAATPTGA